MKTPALVCCALSWLGLLAGCAVGPREFPVGLYDVPRSDFAIVAEAGFNTVIAPAERGLLDDALLHGLKVIAPTDTTQTREVQSLDRHPALAAWYLSDEPDMHLISPAAVQRVNTDWHRVSRRPTLVVLMSGGAVEKYRATADLLAVDWYPVPWAPVATVAREMRLARLGNGGRPFYAVLQAFDWSSAPHLLRTDQPLRPPTSAEIRCMSYLALTQGAKGILYYSYDIPGWKLREHPEQWRAVCELSREVKANAPIFANRVTWWPAETEVHGPPADMYNEIMEARLTLTLHHVGAHTGVIRPGYYIVAVNSSGLACDFSFRLPVSGCEQLDTTCDPTHFQFDGESVRKTYAPYEVCIFGPIQGKSVLTP